MRTGSYITFKYIFRLFLDWLKGKKHLEPMSDYKITKFKNLNNSHIFKGSTKASECGKIIKTENTFENHLTKFLTLEDLRLTCAYLANQGTEICGQCVAGLYSDSEEDL